MSLKKDTYVALVGGSTKRITPAMRTDGFVMMWACISGIPSFSADNNHLFQSDFAIQVEVCNKMISTYAILTNIYFFSWPLEISLSSVCTLIHGSESNENSRPLQALTAVVCLQPGISFMVEPSKSNNYFEG